jgi:hypothetical protein
VSVLYVYAIADSTVEPATTGLHRAPLRKIESGQLAALVSEHPRAPEPDEDTLWAHEQVVEDLMATTAILPLRFGSCVEEAGTLVTMLADRHEEFLASLQRVRGAIEVSVRAELPADPATEEPARDPGSPGSGTAYLLERARREQRGQDAAELVHRPLAALARASVAPAVGGDPTLFKAAYLVEEASLEAFGLRVGELNGSLDGVRVSATGPWPPYSFVGGRSQ